MSMTALPNWLRLVACASAVACGAASAAISTFVYIPGVPGESLDARHARWIDVIGLTVGVADQVCTGMTVTKNIDTSSPLLSGAAINGSVYPSMTVDVVQTNSQNPAFLIYTLSNVAVASIQVTATTGLTEVVTFRPATITMSYRPQLPDGRLGDPVSFPPLTCPKK